MSRGSKLKVFAGLALISTYIASYFCLVRPVSAVYVATARRLENSPGYGRVPAEIFAPIHWLDRKVFRPKMWSFPGTSDEYGHYMGWDR